MVQTVYGAVNYWNVMLPIVRKLLYKPSAFIVTKADWVVLEVTILMHVIDLGDGRDQRLEVLEAIHDNIRELEGMCR